MTDQTYDYISSDNSEVIALQDIANISEEEYSNQIESSSVQEKKKYAGGKKDDKYITSWLRGRSYEMKAHLARNCDNASDNIKIN
ncbi:9958_t:CDS:2, partial [Racocetra persica]